MSWVTVTSISCPSVVRRSGNYHPSIWDDNFIQSLKSEYAGEPYLERIRSLKSSVRNMLKQSEEDLDRLEMIDVLQRLGLGYHFEEEIERAVAAVYDDMMMSKNISQNNEDLYGAALKFRLARQHGFKVLPEVFSNFKEEGGNFKVCLCEDIKGMLHLYEASFHLIEGECILQEARDFTTKNLQNYVRRCSGGGEYLYLLVSHALEVPMHWGMPRLEARWFIDAYENSPDKNPILLEFAKLDFNVVQAIHQQDLKYLSRWWKKGQLGEKLPFARDRLVENFLWSIGMQFEPRFSSHRRMLAKLGVLLTTLDDAYDVYGTLDELQQLTDAIVRWDVNAMEELPDYAKMLFLAIYNLVNQMAYGILRDRGFHVLPYLKKAWADLGKSYLLEAEWYNNGHTPTLREYLDNAWITVTAPLILLHSYFFVTSTWLDNETSETVINYPETIRLTSMVIRLADDLGTSSFEMKRGDNPKSIQCYMHETGASEEDARQHVDSLINETWKKINEDRIANTFFPKTFLEISANLGRMAQCMYQYGDGHGVQASSETKKKIISLLIQPVAIRETEHNIQCY